MRNFSKKKKLALTWFYYVSREVWLDNSKKFYFDRPIKILHFLTPTRIQKMFNITTKHLSFFNNKPPASWVMHIGRDFLTCYSCSYYSSMIMSTFLRQYLNISGVFSVSEKDNIWNKRILWNIVQINLFT